jgi:RNA polymerase sigma factor (sigma-70 family)
MSVRLPPFQALLDAHGADVYRFCVALVGAVEADDCYQETWIAALGAYPRLRRADNLRAWLLRIAQNKAVDAHRARSRRPLPVESVPEPVESVPEPAAVRGASPPPGGGAAEGDPDLWARVRELPPKQRTAVFCRELLGMPYAELALLLECSEDAARRNVHEGLKRLRKEYTR